MFSFAKELWRKWRRFDLVIDEIDEAQNFILNLVRSAAEIATGQSCFLLHVDMKRRLKVADDIGTGCARMHVLSIDATARLTGGSQPRIVRLGMAEFIIENERRRGWYFAHTFGPHQMYVEIDGIVHNLVVNNALTPHIRAETDERIHRGEPGEFSGSCLADRRFVSNAMRAA